MSSEPWSEAPLPGPTSAGHALTISGAINRGVNFYAVANLAVLSTSGLHGLWVAPTWAFAIDDVTLGVIALLAVGWYHYGRNRFRRSPIPLVLLITGLLAKLTGAWLAHTSLGDGRLDATVAVFLAVTSTVTGWYLLAARRAVSPLGRRLVDEEALLASLRWRSRVGRIHEN